MHNARVPMGTMLGQTVQWSPLFRYGRLYRSHRDLWKAGGYQSSEDYAQRRLLYVRCTGEQKTEASPEPFHSRRKTGVVRHENELVSVLYGSHPVAEATSQIEENLLVTIGTDAPTQKSRGAHGQCRRYKEPSGFEIQDRVHRDAAARLQVLDTGKDYTGVQA